MPDSPFDEFLKEKGDSTIAQSDLTSRYPSEETCVITDVDYYHGDVVFDYHHINLASFCYQDKITSLISCTRKNATEVAPLCNTNSNHCTVFSDFADWKILFTFANSVRSDNSWHSCNIYNYFLFWFAN